MCSMLVDLEQAPRGLAAGKPEISKKASGAVVHRGASITAKELSVKANLPKYVCFLFSNTIRTGLVLKQNDDANCI